MTAPRALYAFDGAGMFDLAQAKARGGIIATVYIRGRPGGMAPADRARVNAIRADGMGASPNWEAAANFFDTCSLADAHWAGTDALAALRSLGFPEGVACSFSFDFDTATSRLKEMGQKLQACQDGMGGHAPAMGYGEQELIDYWAVNKIGTPKHWLMMSTFGQPYYPRSPHVCMVQGHDLDGNWIQKDAVTGSDINTVTDARAVRAWWPPGSPYATGGAEVLEATDPIVIELRGGITALKQQIVQLAGEGTHLKTQSIYNARGDIADLKAVVVALASAVARLQPGAPAGVPGPFDATITPKPTP